MAVLFRGRSLLPTYNRLLTTVRSITTSFALKTNELEQTTHTGQVFQSDDYRRVRYTDKAKWVNTQFAIDLIREQPVIVCDKRVVSSDSGGALGHPKVFINLDRPEVHTCGYSGRRFVLKKYYDEATMGPSVTYAEYLEREASGN